MYQVPQAVWNEIAATQPLAHPLWKGMFPLSPTALHGSMDDLEKRLAATGADDRVTLAFTKVAPLLDENLAISRFIEKTRRENLRNSLPEIETVGEATILASRELRLKPSQQHALQMLLKTFPRT